MASDMTADVGEPRGSQESATTPSWLSGLRTRSRDAASHAGVLASNLIDVGSAIFKKRHPQVGARPGTLLFGDDAVDTTVRLIRYSQQDLVEEEITSPDHLAQARVAGQVAWIDVRGFGNHQLIRQIGDAFALHPLAMEDIVNMPQRPKTEAYEDHILVITRMVSVSESDQINMEQVTLVLGDGFVLTFQEFHGGILEPVRKRIRSSKGPIRRQQADYLAYAVIDTIVDGYYPVVEAIGDHLESLEQEVMGDPTPELLQMLHATKNMLVNLRRAIWPQREAVNRLIRDENPLVRQETTVFLRDTYDHCVQTAEVVEMYREMATGLMNAYMTVVANRTNEIMKVLTIMASVFIPLTFVAGIYGMNFEYMPELHVRWAYPLVWCFMGGIVVAMLTYFYRKGWLGSHSSSLSSSAQHNE